MLFKNKIQNIGIILNEQFLLPFFSSIFFTSIIIYLSNLKLFSLDRTFVLYTGLTFGFLVFFLWFKKLDEENKIRKIILEFSMPLFLISLLFITISNFDFLSKFNLTLIKDLNPILILISIFSGFIVFYENRERVEKEIDQKRDYESKEEQKRYLEFSERFPKINRVPIFRNIIRWMYKEGWKYSLGLLVITGIGLILRIWNLGELSFWVDETQSITAAKNFIATGIPYYQDGLVYLRAPLYTFFNILTIYFFGLSELTIRLTPLFFSISTLITMYYLTKKILNKNYSLIASFMFGISSYALLYARYNRFYIALGLLTLLNIYFFYNGFIEKNKRSQILCIVIAFITCGFDAKSFVFLPILFSFLMIVDFKNYKITKYKGYFKWLKKESLIKQKKLLIYLLTTTSSFIIFKKIDSIKTLTGENIRTFRGERFDIDLPIPGFIKELIYPEWDNFFFDFIQTYYPIIFIGIIILFIILFIKIFTKKKSLCLKDLFIYYLFANLIFLSVYTVNVTYYHWDQRHFSFLFGLLIINFIIFLSFIIKSIIKNKFILILTIIIIIYGISPVKQINSVINMNYGDNLIDTSNLIMGAEPYRSDYKTPFEFVNSNYGNGNIVLVSYFGFSFNNLYLNPDISYIFFDKNGDDLENLMEQYKESKIWIIDISYDMKKYHAKYRWGKSYYFMEEYKNNIVYTGLDNETRVFLFNQKPLN